MLRIKEMRFHSGQCDYPKGSHMLNGIPKEGTASSADGRLHDHPGLAT